MSNEVIVLCGAGQLDFYEVRASVVRIPEVILRIREAQGIWDTICVQPFDLLNFLGSENEVFLGNIKLKNFVAAVVQVGLLDRHLKTNLQPQVIIGAYNGDSPLRVALGELAFFDLVADSAALSQETVSKSTGTNTSDLPVLSGVQLVEYAAFQRGTGERFHRMEVQSRDLEKIVIDCVAQCNLRRVIMIGPGHFLSNAKRSNFESRDIQWVDSLDLDPMLSWFWAQLRDNRLAIAN